MVERWKKGQRVSRPTFTAETIDYDTRSATFYRNKTSLSTVGGRVELPFVLPSDSPTPYEQYALSEDYEFRESTLRYDPVTDEFYLNISMRRYDNDESEVSTDTEHPTKRSSVSTSASTVSRSLQPARSGRATTTTTGSVS